MKQHYFITGTDTDSGKTLIASALLYQAAHQGKATLGLKPVSAGCDLTEYGLRNPDALALMEHSTLKLTHDEVNPFAFVPPVAPHIAARQEGRHLSADRIVAMCRGAMLNRYDLLVMEGAGGWRLPLSHRETLAEVPKALRMDVILVVGVKLGCINHALLTVEAIQNDQLNIVGWVANRLEEDMLFYDENITTLKAMIPAPCLGEVPRLNRPTAKTVANYLHLDTVNVGAV